jgi:glyoxylase-like metal-dependent hydrolase (beta-lactamase superfamily II)
MFDVPIDVPIAHRILKIRIVRQLLFGELEQMRFLAVGIALVAVGASASAQQAARGGDVLDVLKLRDNVYLIAGDGTNITVQSGPDGVVLVDSGSGQRSEQVLAAIKGISERPIRYVLNTSAHAEYVGGNAAISAVGDALVGGGGQAAAVIAGVRSGAARLAHENVLLRMSAARDGKPAFAEAAWPTEGFIDKKNLYLNGEAIQVIHQPAALSDGDSIVFFRRSDVIASGHIIDTTRFPVIDAAKGGSIQGEINALNVLVDLAIPPTPLVWQEGGTLVVPGRGHVLEQADVVEYRDMVTIVRDVVQNMVKKGMTLEQIQKAEPTKGYTRRYGATTGPWTTTMFVEAVYQSLTKGASR